MSTDRAVRHQPRGPLIPGQNLLPRPLDRLSLYIHIPFCTSRCRYCNFYFETGWTPTVLDRTLDSILAESRFFRAALSQPGSPSPSIHSVYFGGGTPSIIPPERLDTFLAEFCHIWQLGSDPEFAFEANPETLSPALLQVLGRHGVNRLSLGIQSFSDQALQRLGRRADTAQVETALDIIGQARANGRWQGQLNLDLISGIPGQTLAEAATDIPRLLGHQPDHVSLYSLSEEEGSPLAQGYQAGLWPRPEPELVELMFETQSQQLQAAGFHNYEISNFARPNAESRHNLAYWEMRPYLGLGPGAVGTLPAIIPDGDRPKPVIARLTNPSSMAYSRAGRQHWEHQVEILANHDFLLDHFVVGLRTDRGVNLSQLEQRFHLPPDSLCQLLAPLLSTWEQRDYVQPRPLAGSGHPGLRSANLAADGHLRSLTVPVATIHDAGDPGRLALNPAGRSLLNPLLLELMAVLDPLAEQLDSLPCPDWP